MGAAKEMRDCINAWNQSDIEKSLAQKDIKWKFNPPEAPCFGGIWKRLVRSCKKAMIAVLDGRSFTDDVLITTMCLVEQTLNARPLTWAKEAKKKEEEKLMLLKHRSSEN